MRTEIRRVIHLTSLFCAHKSSQNRYSSKRMVTSKKFILAKQFDGPPKLSDLQLVEEELPALKDGGNTTLSTARLFNNSN